MQVFSKLRNPEGTLDIAVLVQNLVGDYEDTVDFRKEAYKQLYIDLIQNKQEQLFIQKCENFDISNDGTVTPDQLVSILLQISTIYNKNTF